VVRQKSPDQWRAFIGCASGSRSRAPRNARLRARSERLNRPAEFGKTPDRTFFQWVTFCQSCLRNGAQKGHLRLCAGERPRPRSDRPDRSAQGSRCDIVVVTKLDRLGRSTRELLELIERTGRPAPPSVRLAIHCGIRRAHKVGCCRRSSPPLQTSNGI
jgi:hypothetical protein